jgi:uncharacterized LabA/DUF88 family protein
MTPHLPRSTPKRAPVVPFHRGPQGQSAAAGGMGTAFHAPNAALLIDFDNVTMGIRSDLGTELRTLLSSDIVKGKVAVQRAYADWRRYPQYIVPLAESSIDMIMAPAYGSSKKNATDIRLAIDALELVFTRPEIGTFILLSGDSDFSSLVIKLKEYGKYVIGVGIRESSSDLLVMNCDEYYSYNALAGLAKVNEDEVAAHDPWELVTEAVTRMKRNGDVMRSDRLKQVMQEIDNNFDEKELGYSKFSKFCQEAAAKGLLTVTKLENGQLEVDAPKGGAPAPVAAPRPVETGAPVDEAEPRRSRGRGRGRGRGRDERAPREERGPREERRPREERPPVETSFLERAEAEAAPAAPARVEPPREERGRGDRGRAERGREPAVARSERAEAIGISGERLTRDEAFGLVRRAVESLTTGEDAARASAVRERAREVLGRDSESLSERNFGRILRDAHDADVIDLRRRGDDFEVARAADAAPVSEQLARATAAAQPAAAATPAPSLRRGMGPRVAGRGRGGPMGARPAGPPPDLFSVGVVDLSPEVAAVPASVNGGIIDEAEVQEPEPVDAAPARGRRAPAKRGAKTAAKRAPAKAAVGADAATEAPAKSRARGGTRKRAARKKSAGETEG